MTTSNCKTCNKPLHPTESRAGFRVCITCVVWADDEQDSSSNTDSE